MFHDLQSDGSVYLVFGEDEKCYGAYLMRDAAVTRKEEMAEHYEADFRIETYGLGNLLVR